MVNLKGFKKIARYKEFIPILFFLIFLIFLTNFYSPYDISEFRIGSLINANYANIDQVNKTIRITLDTSKGFYGKIHYKTSFGNAKVTLNPSSDDSIDFPNNQGWILPDIPISNI